MRTAVAAGGLALVLIGASACRPAAVVETQPAGRRLVGDGFSIVAPPGATLIRTEPPPPDFDVWTLQLDGRDLAGVYLGNAPDFPGATLPGPVTPATTNPRTMSAPGPDGAMRPVEYLWRTGCAWPSHVHVFALGDDTAVTDQAAAVAASVRPGPCRARPGLPDEPPGP